VLVVGCSEAPSSVYWHSPYPIFELVSGPKQGSLQRLVLQGVCTLRRFTVWHPSICRVAQRLDLPATHHLVSYPSRLRDNGSKPICLQGDRLRRENLGLSWGDIWSGRIPKTSKICRKSTISRRIASYNVAWLLELSRLTAKVVERYPS